jgi:alkanesulfonate monooxygenase SsuD/methylene tetrahydromethanopterin reductase-like flavin-dependent oxidoreductase (luciferase family)
VTVLSSDDPVRVFQRFATVDAISHGRAQAILGRGSFTESFPLFGYDLTDYDVLFDEKLDLFVKLLDEQPVTWSGTTRAALENADVFPKTESGRLDTWVGVGGSPQSVVRTARYGLPLMLAIIGGAPARFAPYVDLYRRAADQLGTVAHPVGMHSPGFIADTDEQAKELFYASYKVQRDRIGALRGWPPLRRSEFDAEVAGGSLYIGSPDTVARKIAGAVQTLGVGRFDLIYTAGAQSISARTRAVELFGAKVAPMVREILGDADADAEAGR